MSGCPRSRQRARGRAGHLVDRPLAASAACRLPYETRRACRRRNRQHCGSRRAWRAHPLWREEFAELDRTPAGAARLAVATCGARERGGRAVDRAQALACCRVT
eukprot:5162321-Pleurochrysis_carterae.AAC.1